MEKKVLGLACSLAFVFLVLVIPLGGAYAATFDDLYQLDWAHSDGGAGETEYTSVVATGDGFVVVGDSSSTDGAFWGNNGSFDAVIVKYNLDGTIAWAHNYGGSGYDVLNSVAIVNDGYIAVGTSESSDAADWGNYGSRDALVVKFNLDGTLAWAKNLGGSGDDEFTSVVPTSDGYMAVGTTSSSNAADWGGHIGGLDTLAVKLNLDGTVSWAEVDGGPGADRLASVIAADDGYIAVGESQGGAAHWGSAGGYDAIVIKYGLDGAFLWAYNSDVPGDACFMSVAATGDGFVTSGYRDGGAAVVARYDQDGTLLWENISAIPIFSVLSSVGVASDGFIAFGYEDSDLMAAKYSFDGTLLWETTVGGSDSEEGYEMTLTSDGFVGVGYSFSTDAAEWAYNGSGVIVKYSLKPQGGDPNAGGTPLPGIIPDTGDAGAGAVACVMLLVLSAAALAWLGIKRRNVKSRFKRV